MVRTDWRGWSVSLTRGLTSFTAQTPRGKFQVSTRLIGEQQVQNTLTALATLSAAGDKYWLKPDAMNKALGEIELPGRFQRVGDWLFDVAHNAPGARALAATIAARPTPRPLTAVLGVLRDKDWRGVIDALAPVVDRFIITQPSSAPAERAWDPIAAAAHANSLKIPVTLEVDFDVRASAALERFRVPSSLRARSTQWATP